MKFEAKDLQDQVDIGCIFLIIAISFKLIFTFLDEILVNRLKNIFQAENMDINEKW